jgi:flagellar protein FliL
MASRDKDLNDDEDAAVKPPKNNKKGLVKWLLLGFGVVLLVGVSVGTSIYVMKSMMAAPADKTAEKNNETKAKENKNKSKEPKVAIYYKFDPPFVVNIQGQSGSRFLQLTLEAMTYDQAVSDQIDQNMPVIRNNILLLLSNLTSEQVATLEGKQKLREDILKEIQKVMKDKIGKPGVEEVYLTSIVMQ